MSQSVGNDTLMNDLLEISLRSAGHDCVVLDDPAEASRILGDDDGLDAIVIEMDLADRSGIEWLEAAAQERPDLPLRTLILTDGEVAPEIAERVSRLGAKVLAKPVSLAQIEAEILGQLEKARSHAIGQAAAHG